MLEIIPDISGIPPEIVSIASVLLIVIFLVIVWWVLKMITGEGGYE